MKDLEAMTVKELARQALNENDKDISYSAYNLICKSFEEFNKGNIIFTQRLLRASNLLTRYNRRVKKEVSK